MPVSSAVVVTYKKEQDPGVIERLRALDGVSVEGAGPKGIAIVMEADDMRRLKDLGDEIEGWDEVLELGLAYFNWEDTTQNQ